MWRDSGEPADSFYAVRPDCSDVTKTRFKIKVLSFGFLAMILKYLILMDLSCVCGNCSLIFICAIGFI